MVVYSVSQVNSYLLDLLTQDCVLRDIWVNGEVANLTQSRMGHTYFTIRDADNSLRCVMFRNSAGNERLSDGSLVVAHGYLSMYRARGILQMVVDLVQPEGVGNLQLQLEHLTLKLEQEGLFEPSRKRSLPKFPRRVGVATSPAGAVWHDIKTVIRRRFPVTELFLAPTTVQGSEAAPEIIGALNALNQTPEMDVIIVARGGGSLEDMRAFNEEPVIRAIFSSKAPVISAVGHETDHTIADLVADRRAPTPSSAAEIAVPDCRDLSDKLFKAQQILNDRISGKVASSWNLVNQKTEGLGRNLPATEEYRKRLGELVWNTSRLLDRHLEIDKTKLSSLKRELDGVNPAEIIRRGYSIVRRKEDESIIKNVSQIKLGDQIRVTVSTGEFEAGVTFIDKRQDAGNIIEENESQDKNRSD